MFVVRGFIQNSITSLQAQSIHGKIQWDTHLGTLYAPHCVYIPTQKKFQMCKGRMARIILPFFIFSNIPLFPEWRWPSSPPLGWYRPFGPRVCLLPGPLVFRSLKAPRSTCPEGLFIGGFLSLEPRALCPSLYFFHSFQQLSPSNVHSRTWPHRRAFCLPPTCRSGESPD